MKHSLIIGAFLSSALLAACGGNHGLTPPTSIMPQQGSARLSGSATEKVIYSFHGSPDGQSPYSPLVDDNGVLFGTTIWGGSSYCANYSSSPGCGTVYRLTPEGSSYKEEVIHAFPGSGKDGDLPLAGLTSNGGTLYGTTDWGGGKGQGFGNGCYVNNGCGTVFKIDRSGKVYDILHRFSGPDGFAINSGIVTKGGLLFGAALGGGKGYCLGGIGCGTIFRLTKGGATKILHYFAGGDGFGPSFVSPIAPNGKTMYGTTQFGGGGPCASGNYNGCGTVFSIDTSGNGKHYKVLYPFLGGTDGATPINVMNASGVLYGTTNTGGGTSCSTPPFPSGCGTIFKIDRGKESVLYNFKGGTDGWYPNALLADDSGTFYGTTSYGGGYGCGGNGCGTVFQISRSGSGYSYSIIYVFKGGTDGAVPSAGVILVNGVLYGTTTAGGGSGCGGNGCGTVYTVTLP